MTQPENLIFNFYTCISEGLKAKCSKCKKEIAMTLGNTTGVRKHLRVQHQKEYEEYLKLVENKEKRKVTGIGANHLQKQVLLLIQSSLRSFLGEEI